MRPSKKSAVDTVKGFRMTDEQKQQAENVAEEQAPQEAVPTSEQKASPSDGVDESAERESSQPTNDDDLSLPEGAKERTSQQFEKLKSQLAEERERRIRMERALQLNKAPRDESGNVPDWYNPETNEVDVAKLKQLEAQRDQKLRMLEQQVMTVNKAEEAKQEAEAYKEFPELDPKSETFDDAFQEQVINAMAISYAKGENPTLKDTAQKVMNIAKRVGSKSKAEIAKQAAESLAPKEQASLEATGRSDRRLPSQDLQQLRSVTKQGGRTGLEAAMQRLSKIPSV